MTDRSEQFVGVHRANTHRRPARGDPTPNATQPDPPDLP
jgi:hypothetical protein